MWHIVGMLLVLSSLVHLECVCPCIQDEDVRVNHLFDLSDSYCDLLDATFDATYDVLCEIQGRCAVIVRTEHCSHTLTLSHSHPLTYSSSHVSSRCSSALAGAAVYPICAQRRAGRWKAALRYATSGLLSFFSYSTPCS